MTDSDTLALPLAGRQVTQVRFDFAFGIELSEAEPWFSLRIGEPFTTTNGLERLNTEIKRRTRVATIFPNEASLLRLASVVLPEISDDWESERAYLTMEAR
jgi:hypothetical protein